MLQFTTCKYIVSVWYTVLPVYGRERALIFVDASNMDSIVRNIRSVPYHTTATSLYLVVREFERFCKRASNGGASRDIVVAAPALEI